MAETAPVSEPAVARQDDVLVVIVNYRTAPFVVRNLDSLAPEVAHGARVVVVDNCSEDGSAETIEAAIASNGWSWASVMRAPVNGGFAYGNNRAVAAALAAPPAPAAFWLLNPDVEVRPGALRELRTFLAAHPRAGIAGSSTELADGRLWPHAFRFPSLLSEVIAAVRLAVMGRLFPRHVGLLTMGQEGPTRVDWLPGASMMVRREVFEQVGMMDEGFFLYFEETDFCLRAAAAGWECWYVPASRVMHIAGQSSGITGDQAVQRRRPPYWFASRRRYWLKHHGWGYSVLTDLAWLLAHGVWQLRRVLQRRQPLDPPWLWWDFLRQSVLFHWRLPGNDRLRSFGLAKRENGM